MTEEIIKLTPYQHVRARTEMYFGSRVPHTQQTIVYQDGSPKIEELTWIPALYTQWREIVDNSLDEIVGHGFGNRIDITYDEATLTSTIQDNGRGIPIDYDADHKMHKATLALTQIMAGRNFDIRENVAGVNGIGASGSCFTSEWFNVEIIRDGKKFTQEYHEGNAVIDELQIKKPKIKDQRGKTGTKITFKSSKRVFATMLLPEKFIRARVFEIAAFNPKLKVFYNGDQIKVNFEKTVFLNHNPIQVTMKNDSINMKFYLVPNFTSDEEHYHNVVNNILAFNGGTHVETFKRSFFSGLINQLDSISRRRKLIPTKSDITDQLLVYSVVNMKSPNFDSQSKTRLINEEIATLVKTSLESEELFKAIIKQNSDWIEQIYLKCQARTEKKDASELAKLSKKILRSKIASLSDANSRNRQECVLYITEGESAKSGILEVRNPKIHGALPLRGKILNVDGEQARVVVQNEVLADLMNSIGLSVNHKADRRYLRYGKVYISCDADEDGKNIGALLINFFYTYWPELFKSDEEPFFFIFNTPFIIATKGKERKYWYSNNYRDFKPEEWKGWGITRAKGLGSLEKDDWKYSLQKPEVFPLIEDGKLKESLSLLFQKDRTDDRKNWLGI